MSNENTSSGGVGFCGLLTIVFITLKLCGVLGWPWWWVLAPIWMPTICGLSIIGIGVMLSRRAERKAKKEREILNQEFRQLSNKIKEIKNETQH